MDTQNRLIKKIYNSSTARDIRKANEEIGKELLAIEGSNSLANSVLGKDFYEKIANLSIRNKLSTIFYLPENIFYDVFSNLEKSVEKDLLVLNSALKGLVIPSAKNIISNEMINYCCFIKSNEFWKLYYHIYSKNTEIAEKLRLERNKTIDGNFERYKNNKASYNKKKITAESLVERFISDSLNNFVINYKTYLIAKESGIEAYVPKEQNAKILEKLYEIATHNTSPDSLLNLYSKLKSLDLNGNLSNELNSELYDMLLSCRKITNDQIVSEVNKLEDVTKNGTITNRNGAKVIDLSDAPNQLFLVHVDDATFPEYLKERYESLYTRNKPYVMSMSLVSSQCISKVYCSNNPVVFGFTNINPHKIIHVSAEDSFSLGTFDGRQISSRPQFLSTPQNILNNTNNYNEINYIVPNKNSLDIEEKAPLMPSYILISKDKQPTADMKKVAEVFNIPILFVPERIFELSLNENNPELKQHFSKRFYEGTWQE